MVALNIAVDCKVPFWLMLDDHDGIPVVDGRADVLAPRGRHTLAWAVRGAGGDRFSAVIREGGREICVIDGWTVPSEDRGWVGDYVKFDT